MSRRIEENPIIRGVLDPHAYALGAAPGPASSDLETGIQDVLAATLRLIGEGGFRGWLRLGLR